jgi:hypothetical protein
VLPLWNSQGRRGIGPQLADRFIDRAVEFHGFRFAGGTDVDDGAVSIFDPLDVGLDDIPHITIIPDHSILVIREMIQNRWLPLEEVLHEYAHDPGFGMGDLTRPIDIGVSEDGIFEAIGMPVPSHIPLGDKLRYGIRGERQRRT